MVFNYSPCKFVFINLNLFLLIYTHVVDYSHKVQYLLLLGVNIPRLHNKPLLCQSFNALKWKVTVRRLPSKWSNGIASIIRSLCYEVVIASIFLPARDNRHKRESLSIPLGDGPKTVYNKMDTYLYDYANLKQKTLFAPSRNSFHWLWCEFHQ